MNFTSQNTSPLTLSSDLSKQLHKQIARVATAEVNILIEGDIGTGKVSWAKEIHNYSNRKLKPLITVDCGSVNSKILSDELFGGANPSISSKKPIKKIGLIECANGGTLLLKNVNQLSPELQERLYFFITNKGSFSRNGENSVQMSDVRIISTVIGTLDDYVNRGEFRQDLFYRLNTIQLNIPNLYRRKDDIPQLLTESMKELGSLGKSFDSEAIKVLQNYRWDGNITQIKSLCQEMSILVDSNTISFNDLPERIKNPNYNKKQLEFDFQSLYDIEKQYILKSLEYFKGNKSQAAQALGITIKTLYNKLHEYGEFEKFDSNPNNLRSIK